MFFRKRRGIITALETNYQKVREKFDDLLKSPVSRRVALATSAVVLPVMAAACGGGSSNSPKTPEGAVGPAMAQPSTGPGGVTVLAEASQTPVQEVPTATAANSEVLTPQQLLEAGTQINGLFTQAFEGLDISAVASKIPQPVERDLQSIQSAVNICTGAAPYPYRDAAEKQRMEQNPTFLYTGISSFCGQAGEASLLLYKALENDPARQAQFKQINMQVETIHHNIIKGFEAKDSRITEATWKTIQVQFYPFGATGTSN